MKTYSIKAGQTNFRPFEPIWPIWKPGGFEIAGRFLPGGWCSLEDWDNDKDWYDWQKLGGITNFFSGNATQTAMFAFAFNEAVETYKITPYTNPKRGRWVAGQAMIVDANETFALSCTFNKNTVYYNMTSEGNKSPQQSHELKRFWLGRRVGTYAGGANNSPGPFGGKTAKDMSIELEFKTL